MGKTIEQKTAKTILNEPDKIIINKREYTVPNPTTATLIAVSAEISNLPKVIGDGNVIQFVLGTAKECEPIGTIVALLLRGKKRTSNQFIETYRSWRIKVLADRVLNEFTPKQLNEALPQILKKMEMADFFSVTTFLIEINMLEKTREVETKTIASGL